MRVHSSSCHCGRVTFEVEAPEVLEPDECNCTICAKAGYGILEQHLTKYKFGTGIAEHPFCSHCGIKAFYYPRAYPKGVSVNARCLDASTIKSMSVTRSFDALNWEEALETYTPPPASREWCGKSCSP